MDTTFFEKIEELGIEVPRELGSYARSLPLGSPFDRGAASVRMEDFFKDVFFDFYSEGERQKSIAAAYTELLDIYRRVIARTTDWMNKDEKQGGPVGRIISWAAKGSGSVALLTFNQDLVLENEIHKRKRLRRLWCVEHGYGAFSDHAKMLKPKNRPASFDAHSDFCDGGSRLHILKLHGSLNWQVKMNGRKPSPRFLAGRGRGHPVIRVTPRRKVPNKFWTFRSTGKRGRSVWYLWPVLIPPVYNKQMLIEQFLQPVWDDAQSALSECERLVLYGYSLPQTDIEAEKLVQRSILANRNLEAVDVINPDPGVAARYAALVPSKPLRWFPSASQFLEMERQG